MQVEIARLTIFYIGGNVIQISDDTNLIDKILVAYSISEPHGKGKVTIVSHVTNREYVLWMGEINAMIKTTLNDSDFGADEPGSDDNTETSKWQ